MAKYGIAVMNIDLVIDPAHDVSTRALRDALCVLAAHPLCLGALITIPCSSYFAGRFDTRFTGPAPVRSYPEHVMGIPTQPHGFTPMEAEIHNRILVYSLDIADVLLRHRKLALFENPPPRRPGYYLHGRSLGIRGRERHAALIDTPPFRDFMARWNLFILAFDQCMHGAPSMKTTLLIACPAMYAHVHRLFSDAICNHGFANHAVTLLGQNQRGQFTSRAAENFQPRTNQLLAEAFALSLTDSIDALPALARAALLIARVLGRAARRRQRCRPAPHVLLTCDASPSLVVYYVRREAFVLEAWHPPPVALSARRQLPRADAHVSMTAPEPDGLRYWSCDLDSALALAIADHDVPLPWRLALRARVTQDVSWQQAHSPAQYQAHGPPRIVVALTAADLRGDCDVGRKTQSFGRWIRFHAGTRCDSLPRAVDYALHAAIDMPLPSMADCIFASFMPTPGAASTLSAAERPLLGGDPGGGFGFSARLWGTDGPFAPLAAAELTNRTVAAAIWTRNGNTIFHLVFKQGEHLDIIRSPLTETAQPAAQLVRAIHRHLAPLPASWITAIQNALQHDSWHDARFLIDDVRHHRDDCLVLSIELDPAVAQLLDTTACAQAGSPRWYDQVVLRNEPQCSLPIRLATPHTSVLLSSSLGGPPVRKVWPLTVVELCGGCGGMALGFEQALFSHTAIFESEATCVRTLRRNGFTNVVNASVSDADFTAYAGTDVVIGGVPCQPFSPAGRGLGEADPRDQFPAAIRAVEQIKPKMFLFENSGGLASTAFQHYRKELRTQLTTLGYLVTFRVIDAVDYGVPQHRKRLLIWGQLPSLEYFQPPAMWPWQTVRQLFGALGPPNGIDRHAVHGQARSYNHHTPSILDLPSKTVTAGTHGPGGGSNCVTLDDGTIRYFTLRELAGLQGFPAGYQFDPVWSRAVREIGNACPPPLAHSWAVAMRRCILGPPTALTRAAGQDDDDHYSASRSRCEDPNPAIKPYNVYSAQLQRRRHAATWRHLYRGLTRPALIHAAHRASQRERFRRLCDALRRHRRDAELVGDQQSTSANTTLFAAPAHAGTRTCYDILPLCNSDSLAPLPDAQSWAVDTLATDLLALQALRAEHSLSPTRPRAILTDLNPNVLTAEDCDVDQKTQSSPHRWFGSQPPDNVAKPYRAFPSEPVEPAAEPPDALEQILQAERDIADAVYSFERRQMAAIARYQSGAHGSDDGAHSLPPGLLARRVHDALRPVIAHRLTHAQPTSATHRRLARAFATHSQGETPGKDLDFSLPGTSLLSASSTDDSHLEDEDDIDFNDPRCNTPAVLASTQFTTPQGQSLECPFPVLPDSGGGQGLVGPDLVGWLRERAPSLVTTVHRSRVCTQVQGVGGATIVEEIVDIKGFTVAGHQFPTLRSVPVLKGFNGLLLGNAFLRRVRGHICYQTYTFTAAHQGEVITAPFRTSSQAEERSSFTTAETALPVVYTPYTYTLGPREARVVECRAPSGIPDGVEVILQPLTAERAGDLNVAVGHCKCRVEKGHVKVLVANWHNHSTTLPLMTPLAYFNIDPEFKRPEPEFTVDEIMDSIHVSSEVRADPRKLDDVRRLLAARRRLVATLPGYAHGVQCHIDTPSVDSGIHHPPRSRQPRFSSAQTEALRAVINEQVKAGYMSRTVSDWDSQPLLVRKPDGSWRLTINLKDVNDLSVGDRYPIPNLRDNLARVGRAKWFSCLDLLAGFHQIELHSDSALKTAFQTPWGQYMYTRMPMGLKSAPSTFCRVVDAMLQGLPKDIAIAYVDDCLVATDGTWDDHVRDLGLVLDRLIEAGFTVKAKKLWIGYHEVPYLGYLVGRDGTRPDPAKTQAILDIPLQRLLDDPQHPSRWVGMLGYYREYIPNFANLVAPFYELQGLQGAERRAAISSLRTQASFNILRNYLINDVVLHRPDFTKPFIVASDASAFGAGAVLAQLDDHGRERPIAFWSHRFKAERTWSVPDREAWALKESIRHFKPYLVGQEFTAYTDQGSTQYLMKHRHQAGSKRERWAAELQEFTDMTILHRPGKLNVVPDALSRLCAQLRGHDPDRCIERPSATPPDETDATADPRMTDVPGYWPKRSFRLDDSTLLTFSPPSSVASLTLPGLATYRLTAVSTRPTPHAQREVGVVFTDGVNVYLDTRGGQLTVPGGPSSVAPHYRAAARVHFVALAGGITRHALEALTLTPWRNALGGTQYFVCRVSGGLPLHPTAAVGSDASFLQWVPIAALQPSKAPHPSDASLFHRLVSAHERRGTSPRLQRLLHATGPCREAPALPPAGANCGVDLKTDSDVPPSADMDTPLRIPPDDDDHAASPVLCDEPVRTSHWLAVLDHVLQRDPQHLLAVDTEGCLRPGGSIDLVQISVHDTERDRQLVIVFDTFKDPSPLTGEGLDQAGRPRSLRAILSDTSISKVLHCARADSLALWCLHGIRLTRVFDTALADCLLLRRNANSFRSLKQVLTSALGTDAADRMRHKGELQHTPGLWRQRPLTTLMFEYSCDDVLLLRDAYESITERLEDDSLVGLCAQLSEQQCYPLAFKPSHPHAIPARRLVVVLHDGAHVVTALPPDGQAALLPSVDIPAYAVAASRAAGNDKHDKQADRVLLRDVAYDCWVAALGPPPAALRKVLRSKLRKPLRVGDTLVFECVADSTLTDFAGLLHLAASRTGAEPHFPLLAHVARSSTPDAEIARYVQHVVEHRLPRGSSATYGDDAPATPRSSFPSKAQPPEQSSATLVVHDDTHCLMLAHPELRYTFGVSRSEEGQRPIDTALRSLSFHGPIAEYKISPALSAAIYTAAARATLLGSHKGVMVFSAHVQLARPLADYASAAWAAFAAKRRTPKRHDGYAASCIVPMVRTLERVQQFDHLASFALRATIDQLAHQRLARPTTHSRAASQVFLFHHHDGSHRLLVQRRRDGHVFVPGGKRHGDESPQQTAARELEEETGIHLEPAQLRLCDVSEGHELNNKWALHDYTAVVSDAVAGQATNREPHKHHKLWWITLEDLKREPNHLDRLLSRAVKALAVATPGTQGGSHTQGMTQDDSHTQGTPGAQASDDSTPRSLSTSPKEQLSFNDTSTTSPDVHAPCSDPLNSPATSHLQLLRSPVGRKKGGGKGGDSEQRRELPVLWPHLEQLQQGALTRTAATRVHVQFHSVRSRDTCDSPVASLAALAIGALSRVPTSQDDSYRQRRPIPSTYASRGTDTPSFSPSTGTQRGTRRQQRPRIADSAEAGALLQTRFEAALRETAEFSVGNEITTVDRRWAGLVQRLLHRAAPDQASSHPRRPDTEPPHVHDSSDIPDPEVESAAAGRPPPAPLPTLSQINKLQRQEFGTLYDFLAAGSPRDWAPEGSTPASRKRLATQAAHYRLIEETICFNDLDAADGAASIIAGGEPRILLPTVLRPTVVDMYHSLGHQGVRRTETLVRKLFYFPRMRKYIARRIGRCGVCVRSKLPRYRAGAFVRIEDGDHPWDVATIDLYEWELVDGYDHVLVIVCGFSRAVEAIPIQGVPSSSRVLDILFDRVIRGHRICPRYVRSDRGSIFISELCQEFHAAYGTEMRVSTAEHHSTAGLAERFNATLRDYLLTHRAATQDRRWYRYVGHFELAHNATINDTTHMSPTFVEYGRDAILPYDLAYYGIQALGRSGRDIKTYVREHVTALHLAFDHLRNVLGLNAIQRKQEVDAKRDRILKFEVHDRVLIRHRPGHAKWEEPFHGPYRIADVLGNDNYRIRDLHTRRLHDVVHVERLVPYPESTIQGDHAPPTDEDFVQRIVDRKPLPGGEGYLYKVRWRGKTQRGDTWHLLADLGNCLDLVREYNRSIDPLPDPPPALPLEPSAADAPAVEVPLNVHGYYRNRPQRSPADSADEPQDDAADDDCTHDPDDDHTSPAGRSPDAAARPEDCDFNRKTESGAAPPDVGEPPAPSTDTSADSWAFKSILDVERSTRRGYRPLDVLVDWHPSWIPLTHLNDAERQRALQLAVDQRPLHTPPDLSTLGPCTRSYEGTVDDVIDIRTAGHQHLYEVRVTWLPMWLPLSRLNPTQRAVARQMEQAKYGATSPTPPTDPTTAEHSEQHANAACIVQASFRLWLSNRDPTFVCDLPRHPLGPLAIQLRNGTPFFWLRSRGQRWSWVPWDSLRPHERRRCHKALIARGINPPAHRAL